MFTHAHTASTETIDGRDHIWHSKPGLTPTDDLLVVHCTIPPGGCHAFHTHPNKEEVIYVIEGEAEQWLEQEKQSLGPGSSVYVPKSAVHATFNRTDRDLKFIAIITPCSAEGEIHVAVDQLEPWKASLAQEGMHSAAG
ncbi:cupin domain-containing protein [Akkermansiaceae bacterium]|nr:cupin domain-containing protein [Akkermansiaceae bacterium]